MLGKDVVLVIEDVWGGPPRPVLFPDAPAEGGTRRLTIGRSADCDVALDDPGRTLSRRHLELDRRADGLMATDVSLMGTWLGGARMPQEIPIPLDHGDVMTFSHFRVSVQVLPQGAGRGVAAPVAARAEAASPRRAKPAAASPTAAKPVAAKPEDAPASPAAAGADDDAVDLDALLGRDFTPRGD